MLREKVTEKNRIFQMKEKALITSFFATMSADSALSYYFITYEKWREASLLASFHIEQGNFENLIIAKMGFTAVLIGTYALAAKIDSRWEYPTRKALQISNVIMWGVVAWNTAQILSNRH